MLAAIQFDVEFLASGAEVNHVIANRMLRSKVNALHTMGSQSCPELSLQRRQFTSQFS